MVDYCSKSFPAYFPEEWDSEDYYGDIDSPASSNFTQHDGISDGPSGVPTPVPKVCVFRISAKNYPTIAVTMLIPIIAKNPGCHLPRFVGIRGRSHMFPHCTYRHLQNTVSRRSASHRCRYA